MIESGAVEGEFKEYWERFAAHLKQLERSPLTVKNYHSDLKAFQQWLNTSEPALPGLTQVSWEELIQYQEFLLIQQKLNPRSVNRRMGTLKSFYTWLHQNERSTKFRFPIMPVPVKAVSVERPKSLTQVEQQSLLEAVQRDQNPRDLAIVKLLLYTGIRVGELCKLRWADIKIGSGKGVLLVRQLKSYLDKRIVLPPEVCAALLDLGYQTQAGSQAPVFVGQRGGMTSTGVRDVLKRYGLQVGLKNLNPRMLRVTCVTRLMAQGMDSADIAGLMGTSAGMMLHYYQRLSPIREAPP
ncbi:tyrosine-type recombinase/integrase (plasmid) [Phormidium sp. CLA17]|uniref:tyrosine-type recombinase/integrase n=1 Tax=Leptolyngbya sp. Cla-17 TaxID=2803751 RepID=UPI001490D757|nr:tyrosine-type recombinase/integrase [Leptolyngbya sp. Cla-17]